MSVGRRRGLVWLLAGLFMITGASPVLGQGQRTREVGFGGGGSFYPEKSFQAPAGDAKAGFDQSFGISAWFGQDLYNHVSGEVRYLFENNGARVQADGTKVGFSGRSHAVHYDILIHASGREASIRPFFSIGAGAKGFYGTGTESATQPLQDYAVLTKTSEWKPVIVFGGGVKIRAGARVVLRAEVKDYFSQFPTEVIAPAPGANLGGWIHNLVPMFSIGITF